MKKLFSLVLLLSIMVFIPVAHPQTPVARATSVEATDPGFVVLDVLLYRPLGFVATLVGGAVFVGMSPLTALASIPAPHDAFNKTFNILVLTPAAYTFVRPVGDRRFIAGYTPQYRAKPIPSNAMPLVHKRTPPIKQLPAVP
ncbi:MAG: hypothetical protein HOP02_09645 [Methylococcaceae bacterium]|nr:hypothetical protein [Methylococcaceae bacterium]